jgi:hypothetical protein
MVAITTILVPHGEMHPHGHPRCLHEVGKAGRVALDARGSQLAPRLKAAGLG